jgi:hypothetical protein
MEVSRISNTCVIQQVGNSSKNVIAEVHEFKENDKLVVVLNKSVKLPMKWNGRMYEGRMAGIDFVTAGPTVNKATTSIRG